MLQLVGSPAGGPFTQLPLPVDAVTLVVVETALVTPALAAVADSSITSPEKASSAARRPEIRVLNMRALEKRSIRYLNVSGAGPFTTVQSHRRAADGLRLTPWSPTPVRNVAPHSRVVSQWGRWSCPLQRAWVAFRKINARYPR